MQLHTIALSLAGAVLLSGCLLPEKFTASAVVQPDASIQYQYKGTAVHAMALLTRMRGGRLDANDNSRMEQAGKQASTAGSNLRYVGDGRYEVKVDTKVVPGAARTDMQVFRYASNGATYTIESMTGSPKEREELQRAGYAPDGSFEVTLPSGAKVISHNADSAPWFFRKSYKWDIQTLDKPASLVFSLKQSTTPP